MEAPQGTQAPRQESNTVSMPDNAPTLQSEIPVKVKKEEPEDDRVDTALAIFDDVDDDSDDEGPELVDDNYVGIVEQDGVKCWVCPGFKIPQIPEVFVVKRPLNDLCEAIKTNDIILNPDYQRDVVWDDMRSEGLIVSLLMGYLPPPIIFNVKLQITETPNGKLEKHIRTCVDGKQRLTSILRFMRGEIGFLDSRHKKWYFQQPALTDKKTNGTDNILPTELKKFFMSRFFICYEYNELSQSTEEEMFQLVQRGIALTPAEKMRAMSTEWAKFARKFEEDYPIILNLSKQGRASGFRLTLTIFAMVQEIMSTRRKSTSVPTLQASPQALTRMLEEKQPINPALKLKMKEVFDRYESLIKDSSTRITTTRYRVNADSAFDTAPSFLRGQGFDHVRTFSPIELLSAGLLVCYHMDTRTNAQLLNDVMGMRRHVRVKHKDLRINAQCWTTVWEFIVGIGKSDNAVPIGSEASNSDSAQRNLSASSNATEVAKNAEQAAVPTSPPSGNLGSRSDTREKTTTSSTDGGKSKLKARNKAAVSKPPTSKPTTKSSKANGVSALGQSRAGFEVNGKSNKGTSHAKASGNRHPDRSSKNNSGKKSSTPSRRSTRSSGTTTSDNTIDMSTRLTTGWDEFSAAEDETGTRAAIHESDAEVDEGTYPATSATNRENLHYFDDSDDSGSLSSVHSSALNSPVPEELAVRRRKRSLSAGANGVREAKKSKG